MIKDDYVSFANLKNAWLEQARGGEVEIFHNGQVGDGGVDGVIEAPKTYVTKQDCCN